MSMWNSYPDCKRRVGEVWRNPVHGFPMFVLIQKLKNLKSELKSWNKLVCGDVHLQVKLAQESVDVIQSKIDSDGFSEVFHEQELIVQNTLQQALHYQEVFWKEKAK